ncbi:MAG TPA: hypothetical protein VGD60_09970 [Candidatus Acidoferrales bacterium]
MLADKVRLGDANTEKVDELVTSCDGPVVKLAMTSKVTVPPTVQEAGLGVTEMPVSVGGMMKFTVTDAVPRTAPIAAVMVLLPPSTLQVPMLPTSVTAGVLELQAAKRVTSALELSL